MWEPLLLEGHVPEGPDDPGERYLWAHRRLLCDLLAGAAAGREPLPLVHRDHPLERAAGAG